MSQPISLFHCIPSDRSVWGGGIASVWMIEAVERKTTRIPWCICLWMERIYFLLRSFFFCAAGDELPGEWIRKRRSLIPSLFLLPRGVWQTTHRLIGTHSEVKGDWKTSSRESEAQNEIVCCGKTVHLCGVFVFSAANGVRLQRPHAWKESRGHHCKHLNTAA